MDPEFRKQVKDALEHLYDTAYLETHSLLPLIAGPASANRLTRAQKLRSLLKETIEKLRPPEGTPPNAPEWRSYSALRYRYVQGMSLGETEHELGISQRQLQRELHKGLDATAALLWDARVLDGTPTVTETPALDETRELQNELNQWNLTRQSYQGQTLLDEVVWMLKPLLEQRAVTLNVSIPATLAPVFVDSTLTRQALFKVLRALVSSSEKRTIALSAIERGKHVEINLQGHGDTALQSGEDWRAAQLLFTQQGGTLEIEARAEGTINIILTLPRASQPRVLVIDDNQGIHQLFERYLAPHNYEIVHAYGGQEALQLAAEHHPEAITLDVMMPSVDGWQVLRGLMSNPATAQTPIIICSVLKEPELAFSLGARAYLKKPVDRLELVATLARLLQPANPAPAAPPSIPEDKSAPRSL